MTPERTEFVDVFPSTTLATGLALVKGNNPTAKALGLAGENALSYACGLFIGNATPVFANRSAMMAAAAALPEPTAAEFEAAVKNVSPGGAMKAGPASKVDWMTILKTLLPFILGLL